MMKRITDLLRSLMLWAFPSAHVLKVDFRTDRHDTATTVMSVSFAALVNFIEVEKALVFITNHPEHNKVRPRWYNWAWWRKAELGVLRLKEEAGFTTAEGTKAKTAEIAEEMLVLYDWWLNRRKTLGDVRSEFKKLTRDHADLLLVEEEKVMAQDQAMYMRLAAIRNHLVS